MKIILFLCSLLSFSCWANEPINTGEYLGSIPSETPAWFKASFLDLIEDVEEAKEENKRVMLYFHQHGCPYCAKLVNENFTDPNTQSYVQQKFEGITINMWGDKEVVSVGDRIFSEKDFALALKVQYTPTILFLNEKGKTILRLNGYYPPEKFKLALKYAGEHLESKISFNQYMVQNSEQSTSKGKLNFQDFFIKTNNIKNQLPKDKAIAVFFEATHCKQCDVMHERILGDKPTRALVKELTNIQLNANSNDLVTTPSGSKISIKNWSKQLNIGYFPSVVFFDTEGKEVMRIAGFLKTFHFQSVFDYVREKAYLTEPSFQRYIADRGEKIREAGFSTDIWGYDSYHKKPIISQ